MTLSPSCTRAHENKGRKGSWRPSNRKVIIAPTGSSHGLITTIDANAKVIGR